jgi:hypothetical protein
MNRKKYILCLLIVFIVCSLSSCVIFNSRATEIVYIEIPYSKLEQSIAKTNSRGHGFIVEAYFVTIPGAPENNYTIPGQAYQISETPGGTPSSFFYAHGSLGGQPYASFNYFEPRQFEPYGYESGMYDGSEMYKRIDKQKKYRIFFGVYFNTFNYRWIPRIDKIEGLRTMSEVRASEAERKAADAEALAARRQAEAEALEARKKAEAEVLAARRKAEEEAHEAKQNPNRLDRSLYRVIKVEEFSFDMVTGRLPVGSKVAFTAKFSGKPTGTDYRFSSVNGYITVSTTHNFVRDIPDKYFGTFSDWLVKVYVTVKRAGQTGECSVDIVEWQD